MKKSTITAVILLMFSVSFLFACNENDDIKDPPNQTINQKDKEALLFMLEEEKLARDTYTYLNNLWSMNQFSNIKNSEQTHMDAIVNLLEIYQINYTILPVGQFENESIQNYYNRFVTQGSLSSTNALKVGATIEDLDIVDLEEYINSTTNPDIITVFKRLQCGSKKHLKSFNKGIVNFGETYTPQFLTQEAFNSILSESNGPCY
ncbi:DUF2202 domain-containing protein [Mariniflexile aquimaris]|uniref:DUF2202 domain-containing protein n=1 Tax=Mariniflexile aquimaris TaxID=881009 RepID=A0ABW3BVG5_9FLAO